MNTAVNRRMTTAFIAVKPDILILTPRTRVKKPAGGWTWEEEAPREPQTMTMIEHSGPPQMITTQDGVERKVEFELLGEWDAGMAVGDVFSYKGRDWEVAELWVHNDYETRGRVVGRG